jgi:hypothetical protein
VRFSARTLFPKNSECVLRKKNREASFITGCFHESEITETKRTPRQAIASAGVAFAPKGPGEHTHTKEQYKTPHVQCLCTRVWETHIIGYQFDNEAGSEARFSFADCFLGVSIRPAAT